MTLNHMLSLHIWDSGKLGNTHTVPKISKAVGLNTGQISRMGFKKIKKAKGKPL